MLSSPVDRAFTSWYLFLQLMGDSSFFNLVIQEDFK